MSRVLFITHPEVHEDPAVPVADWPLTERGREQMRLCALTGVESSFDLAGYVAAGHVGLVIGDLAAVDDQIHLLAALNGMTAGLAVNTVGHGFRIAQALSEAVARLFS